MKVCPYCSSRRLRLGCNAFYPDGKLVKVHSLCSSAPLKQSFLLLLFCLFVVCLSSSWFIKKTTTDSNEFTAWVFTYDVCLYLIFIQALSLFGICFSGSFMYVCVYYISHGAIYCSFAAVFYNTVLRMLFTTCRVC